MSTFVLLPTLQGPRLGESLRKEVYLPHRFEGPKLRDASGAGHLAGRTLRPSGFVMVKGGVHKYAQTCLRVSVSSLCL